MIRFPSTLLATSNDPTEIRKADLDLLDKINQMAGTGASSIISVSADYTVLDAAGITSILVTTGAVLRTITLPTLADNQGRYITIIKVDNGVGEVLVDGEGAELVNIWAGLYLGLQYRSLTVLGGPAVWIA